MSVAALLRATTVGLFAEHFLQRSAGSHIILDPRLTWNTLDVVTRCGGIPVISKTGHAFIKARMREEDAVYGGEMSGHHYFRDFGYCDSGMIPLVLLLQIIGSDSRPLSAYIEHAGTLSGFRRNQSDGGRSAIGHAIHRLSLSASRWPA